MEKPNSFNLKYSDKITREIFEKMIQRQSISSQGEKPDFQEEILEGYYFDIAKQDSGIYYYETRWAPNILDLELIGRHCNVSFISEFEELGNYVFGKAKFDVNQTDGLQIMELDHNDISDISYDEEDDLLVYKDQKSESDREILEQIFQDKFDENYQNTNILRLLEYVKEKEIEKEMEKEMEKEIEKAREVLREAGYYVDNLWHIDDVRTLFENVTDEQAQEILDASFQNEATFDQIWMAIECAIDINLERNYGKHT